MKNLMILVWVFCFLFLGNILWGQENTVFREKNDPNGNWNTSIGLYAGGSITNGLHNTYIGRSAGFFTSTGSNNTFSGATSGYYTSTGSENTFTGFRAGFYNSTGYHNTFTGRSAGNNNTTGYENVYIGVYSGYSGTSASFNSFIGKHAGFSNTTGNENTFLGKSAGYDNKTGNENTFLGRGAGHSNISGHRNVFLGYRAGWSETSSDKLYIANTSGTPLIYGNFFTRQIGINTKDLGTHTLSVNGTARAKEILVKIGWGDYVFHTDYQLPTLAQEAQHIKENGHLSGFQSAEEMNGEIQLGDVTKRQQVKMEEMMLHLIKMNERLEKLEQENAELKAVIKD